jgi:erythromycin esterase
MGKFIHLTSLLISFSLMFICYNAAGRDPEKLAGYFSRKALPLANAGDLDRLIEKAGSRKLVLLGEASHGTSEFYQWRAEITKRLISEKGFSFVAVEGDWASIYRLNKYVRGLPGAPSSARKVLRGFNRWPEWMWGNRDVEELAEWMRDYNNNLPDERKVGFYGMDVYGQWEAMDDLLEYTRKYLPGHHREISRNLQCFANYDRDEWVYARAVTGRGHPSCEEELNNVVELLRAASAGLREADEKKYVRAKQNAIVVRNAEDFFRLAVTDNTGSWNSRATHMWESVHRLLNEYGENSRAVVWAHNTHVGDADATSMHFHDMVNIGRLSRRELGREQVFITGFGTYTGRVNAGSSWGSVMQRMQVPEGIKGSYEDIFGQTGLDQFYLVFDDEDRNHPDLKEFRGHRAIGVVYDPGREAGNYVPTILPERYDAFIFIRNTSPLVPVR